MNHQTTFQEIASQLQLFQSIEQKERFIFVIGALTSRLISLYKASEIMGIDFSYLTVEDVVIEKIW
jgi:hypothetical protein